jgi:hypothetical protein
MGKKMMRISGMVGLMVMVVSLMFLGCGKEQAPPPAPAAPPATSAAPAQPPAAPPAGTAQPSPGGAPAQATAPSQDSTQIQVGMTGEQVQQIMGPAGQTKQEGSMIEWKYLTPKGKVEVKLQNNKVVTIERH